MYVHLNYWLSADFLLFSFLNKKFLEFFFRLDFDQIPKFELKFFSELKFTKTWYLDKGQASALYSLLPCKNFKNENIWENIFNPPFSSQNFEKFYFVGLGENIILK